MANSYLQAVFSLPLFSKEQQEWAEESLRFVDKYYEAGRIDPSDLSEKEQKMMDELGDCFTEMDDDAPFIQWHIQDTVEAEDAAHGAVAFVQFKSDEAASMELTAYFIQAFLRKFRPGDGFWLTWAVTCDKERDNHFTGGGAAITATEVKWFSPEIQATQFLKSKKMGSVAFENLMEAGRAQAEEDES